MKVRWIFAVAATASPFAQGSALAHHSFAAEFDRDKPLTVTGAVTKVEWTNPHARFYVDAKDEGTGQTVSWDFELGTPNLLMRRGWTHSSMKLGDVVTVSGFRAKNSPHVGNANTVTLADGKKLFAGSSSKNEPAQGAAK